MNLNERTPYRKKFGDFIGPFTFSENVEDSDLAVGRQEFGEIFFLLKDSGDKWPCFCRAEFFAIGGDWDDAVGNDWQYLSIHQHVKPLEIKSEHELELMCMLYPRASQTLRNHFKERK